MANPIRRAGYKQGDHWPSPNDGRSGQNAPKGEYTEKDMAYKGTNEECPPGIGKGNPGVPAAEAANKKANRNRTRGGDRR